MIPFQIMVLQKKTSKILSLCKEFKNYFKQPNTEASQLLFSNAKFQTNFLILIFGATFRTRNNVAAKVF